MIDDSRRTGYGVVTDFQATGVTIRNGRQSETVAAWTVLEAAGVQVSPEDK